MSAGAETGPSRVKWTPVSGRTLADEALRRGPSLKVLFTTGYTRNTVVHNGALELHIKLIGRRYNVKQLSVKVRAILHG